MPNPRVVPTPQPCLLSKEASRKTKKISHHVAPIAPKPAPSSVRRSGASNGASPVPIGPTGTTVQAPEPKILEHADYHTGKHIPDQALNANAIEAFILYNFEIRLSLIMHNCKAAGKSLLLKMWRRENVLFAWYRSTLNILQAVIFFLLS